MTRNEDLFRWAEKPGRPKAIRVAASRSRDHVEQQIVDGLGRDDVILLDAGLKPDRILAAASYADLTLIPVRFSPLSAYWAVQTDKLLKAAPLIGKPLRRAFVATGITQIPSRVARQVEARIDLSRTARLPAGLVLRAAQEAPFLHGGTIFSLADDTISGLEKARVDVMGVLREIEILDRPAKERFIAREPTIALPVHGPATAISTPCASSRPGAAPLFGLFGSASLFRSFESPGADQAPALALHDPSTFAQPDERAFGPS